MVHISDGILSPAVWMAGFAITATVLAWTLKKTSLEEIPKFSMVTAAVFVASLLHIKVWPTSVHLVLNGLAGITLGLSAYPSIFTALVLQAFLFQHGGITTLGINAINMGLPAFVSYGIFKSRNKIHIRNKELVFGAIAGGVSVALTILMASVALITSGRAFSVIATAFMVVHTPVIVIEAAVVGFIASFLGRVKPEALKGEVKK